MAEVPAPSELLLQGPDDFLRLDGVCVGLLRGLFAWLQAPEGGSYPPEEASRLAHAADRFVRDFVVDIMETGPADADAGLPSRYLANWYIIHTLAPTHEEVDLIRAALERWYRFASDRGILPRASADAVAAALADGSFFHERLESFWDLTPEGIPAWRAVHDYRRRPGAASAQ